MAVGLVDTWLVGHLGAPSVAAVGLSNQAVMLVTAFISAVATGSTALVARHVGAREPRLANRIMQQSFLLAGSIGAFFTLLCLALAEPTMRLLQAQGEVIPLGATYLQIVAVSFLLTAFMFIGNASLRGAGDTRTPMQVMLLINGVNIVVAYTFIYGFGPIPAMGVAGSAIGAASARALGGLIIVALLLRGRSGLRLNLRDFSLDWAQIKRILNIGLPAGGEMMFMRFGQTAFAMVVAGLGTASFAAHQLALQSESISFMPGFGFAVAATTLVGQELGAKNPRRAQERGYAALRLAIVVMSAMGLVFFVFAPQFLGFFIDDPEVIGLGVTPLRMVAVFQVPLAAAMVLSGGLRGAGDTRWTMLITAAGLWLLRVPLSMILTSVLGLGLVGAWMAMGVDLVARGSAAYWRFNNGGWTKLKV